MFPFNYDGIFIPSFVRHLWRLEVGKVFILFRYNFPVWKCGKSYRNHIVRLPVRSCKFVRKQFPCDRITQIVLSFIFQVNTLQQEDEVYTFLDHSFLSVFLFVTIFVRNNFYPTLSKGDNSIWILDVEYISITSVCAVIRLVYTFMCCVLNFSVFFVFLRMCWLFRLYPFMNFLCVPVTSNL